MPVAREYDLLVKNVRVVRPNRASVQKADVALKDGKFARVARDIPADDARTVVDGKSLLAFPGLVDPHMHTGIYSPLAEDAVSESRAAAQGGVTSSINYFRTGQYYLNNGGPYADFYPEVLEISKGRFHVDYAYHLAPMDRSRIDEIPMLVDKHGVTSFRICMFYGGHGLHGASSHQHEFLMIDAGDKYDIAPGYDADMVPFDPDRSLMVRAAGSESTQGYTPFEGTELTGKVVTTFLRGHVIYDKGKVVGPARGRYLSQPC